MGERIEMEGSGTPQEDLQRQLIGANGGTIEAELSTKEYVWAGPSPYTLVVDVQLGLYAGPLTI